MELKDFLVESNKIEGISSPVTVAQMYEAQQFLKLKELTLESVCDFVEIFQPNARLREYAGLNVRIGDYAPPPGGPIIKKRLSTLLVKVNQGLDPYIAHNEYEALHPFTDCNGRSGRIIWLWQMTNQQSMWPTLGFLHTYYYDAHFHLGKQALQHERGR